MKVGVLSSYPNPLCGISNHTKNLLSFMRRFPELEVIPLQPFGTIPTSNGRYFWAPNYIEKEALADLDLIWIQHEPGLHLPLDLLNSYTKNIPKIYTLHQVRPGEQHLVAKKVIVHFPELASNKDIVFMPHGCRDLKFRISQEEAKEMLDIKEDFVFVCPGRLETRKRIFQMIETMKELDRTIGIFFVGSVPNTGTIVFRRWIRFLKCLLPSNMHLIDGESVPQFIMDLYCKAADFLFFNNEPTFYSVSGAAQACFEFNKIGIFPENILLFAEFNEKNSFKFYNEVHLKDIIVKLTKEKLDCSDKYLQLAEDFELRKFSNVANMYYNLFKSVIEREEC